MATPIITNNIKFPYGTPYLTRGTGAVVLRAYNQFSSYGPSAVRLGSTATFTFTAVPANNATMTVTSADGHIFLFEFLYPAAVPTAGKIGISLPLGAGSTNAQVTTATLAVLNSGLVTPQGGLAVRLPWNVTQLGAAQLRLNFNTGGFAGNVAATGVALNATNPQSFAANAVVPARFGKCFAVLPGV